ncbi:hypothetical protein FH972_020992 [Carpinus fangiana]|uniref:1-phosphatidylinositol-3-phosphate 5-kinase n=1 Tax=Carpinus fangiana TaxID=176857 RepID=A0A5N6KN41_9ROSI|nr:hypothetical protein FH972_020992 [Carpinus fangiana]
MFSNSSSRPTTPLSSSVFPTGHRPRRGSLASIASRAQLDKDVMSQALDDIHSSASQSATLTTFNDFGPPPTPSSASDERTSAGQLVQQGIGNIYSRFRASKAHTREKSTASTSSLAGSLNSQLEKATPKPHAVLKDDLPSHAAGQHSKKKTHPSQDLSSSADRHLSSSIDSQISIDTIPRPDLGLRTSVDRNITVSDEKSSYPASRASTTKSSPSSHVKHGHRTNSAAADFMHSSSALAELARPDKAVDSVPASPLDLKRSRNQHLASDMPLLSLTEPNNDRRASDVVVPARQLAHHRTESGLAPVSTMQSASAASSVSGSHSPTFSIMDSAAAIIPRPNEPSRNQSQSSVLLHEMRRKVLSRDFWMKDENAKVCFRCGDQFSTFRRKHHCRTCGQIYDAKCTVLTSGKPFGQASKLRVCKTCEAILNGDDSSDYSEDDSASINHVKQLRFSENPEEIRPSTPLSTSAVGALRKAQEMKRRPGSSEALPPLARPSSSRSLKSLSNRPRSSSHRHRRVMHQHMRSLGTSSENGVPFQPSGSGNSALQSFHADSIIDPELAPYMSDEGSSDEEVPSIAAQMSGSGQETTPGGLASLVGAGRRAKHKASQSVLDASQFSRDPDNLSLTSARVGQMRRQMGVRTLSSGSLVGLHGNSPRVIRSQNLLANYGHHITMLRRPSVHGDDDILQESDLKSSEANLGDHDESSVPAAELNKASLDHVKFLLRQFLKDNKIDDTKRWEKTLIPILLRCAEEVDPNINRGDDIDIRHYVKMKKAPGGTPKDSAYVSGVVFTKNLALRGMPRLIKNPRILLVSFPIVYDRHQQHFMSLEPVIAQEREYLRNLTNRIKALKPSVVLVQKQVAGLAVEFLHEAHIAVAFNVKESVLQAISRCTQTRVISSVDRLTMNPEHLGQCQRFEVRTFIEHDVKKPYIFVAGCQRDLGCTILLRGADKKTLSNLKWITEFMCFVVYNLKLETCLMRDEFVAIPSMRPAHEDTVAPQSILEPEDKAFCGKLVSELKTRILSVSPFVKLDEPYLLLRGREQEQQLQRLRKLLDEKTDLDQEESEVPLPKFEMIRHEMLFSGSSNASPQLKDALRAIHEAEYDRTLHRYQALKRRWEAYVQGAIEPFNPLSHQQIVVLFSIVSTPSGDACEGPDLLGLDFYQEHDIENNLEPDVPLGEYIERLCHQSTFPCTAQRCDKSMLDHHRQYVHGDGQLTISLTATPSKIRGMENTILMWSCCRHCDAETQVVPMSRNTWKYSFGKYLELSYWSESMHARAGSCPHDIHKDHTRYFGFKGMAVCIQHEPINIMEVLVPRATVAWKVDKDISMKNDQYQRIEERMTRFLGSVKARIRSIKIESVEPDKSDECKLEIGNMLKRIGEEQDFLRNKLQEKYMTSKHYEIIPLNRAVRAMQEKVAEWDSTFADFERNYFPSETDIRKLAAQQLRRVYLEAQGEDTADNADDSDTMPDAEDLEKAGMDEKAMLSTDTDTSQSQPVDIVSGEVPATIEARAGQEALNANAQQLRDIDAIQRLDLAVPSDSLDQTSPSQISPEHLPRLFTEGSMESTRSDQKISPRPHESFDPGKSSPDAQKRSTTQNTRLIEPGSGPVVSPPLLLRSQTSPSAPSRLQRKTAASDATASDEIVSTAARLKGAATNFGLDKKQTSGRLGMVAALRTGKTAMQSMIPRSIPSKRNDTKVSALAKHFEQMSREFEKERLKERKQRAARNIQARVYPMASYRPIVEVFRDATEAAREREVSLDDHPSDGPENYGSHSAEETTSESTSPRMSMHDSTSKSLDPEHIEGATLVPSFENSDADLTLSEAEPSISGVTQSEDKIDQDALSFSEQLELPIDLPKHDRSSLMKMLTSFWSERSASGWNSLEYPLMASDHIFADSDIVVREDEPSSLVAFALASQDYTSKLQRFRDRAREAESEAFGHGPSIAGKDTDVERTLLGKTATHMKYQFQAESARMQCKVFYAESFDAIRRKCGVEDRFVESLSRCAKWDSKGGKSKSLFLRTLDERFVLKSLSPVETQAFLKFAPDYFDYMSKCLFHNLPSCLAKMLGFYQVVIKNPLTGIEFSYFLQVMENVFYENPSNRLFDLKGSMRNRRVESTGEKDEVLLDENMLDYISHSPIYVRNHSNALLASSITNDTLFCSKQNVMDYSLIVGLYDDRKELMVGIIDYIRTYTWDKKLESWIKDRGTIRNGPLIRAIPEPINIVVRLATSLHRPDRTTNDATNVERIHDRNQPVPVVQPAGPDALHARLMWIQISLGVPGQRDSNQREEGHLDAGLQDEGGVDERVARRELLLGAAGACGVCGARGRQALDGGAEQQEGGEDAAGVQGRVVGQVGEQAAEDERLGGGEEGRADEDEDELRDEDADVLRVKGGDLAEDEAGGPDDGGPDGDEAEVWPSVSDTVKSMLAGFRLSASLDRGMAEDIDVTNKLE